MHEIRENAMAAAKGKRRGRRTQPKSRNKLVRRIKALDTKKFKQAGKSSRSRKAGRGGFKEAPARFKEAQSGNAPARFREAPAASKNAAARFKEAAPVSRKASVRFKEAPPAARKASRFREAAPLSKEAAVGFKEAF